MNLHATSCNMLFDGHAMLKKVFDDNHAVVVQDERNTSQTVVIVGETTEKIRRIAAFARELATGELVILGEDVLIYAGLHECDGTTIYDFIDKNGSVRSVEGHIRLAFGNLRRAK